MRMHDKSEQHHWHGMAQWTEYTRCRTHQNNKNRKQKSHVLRFYYVLFISVEHFGKRAECGWNEWVCLLACLKRSRLVTSAEARVNAYVLIMPEFGGSMGEADVWAMEMD